MFHELDTKFLNIYNNFGLQEVKQMIINRA